MASEAITRNDLTNILNEVLPIGNNPVDYVIEQGSTTVGSIHWTYRKWNSGVAECWGYSPTISANCSTAYGYGYYAGAQTNQNYPTDLFIDVPRIIVVPISGDGVYMGISAITKVGFAFYPYCNASGSHYMRWDCHAIGWWK